MSTFHDLIINDVAGSTLGVYLTTVPPITPAPERGDWVEIAGRDGRTWVSDYALDTTKLNCKLYITPQADIGRVNAWIYGAETLRISGFSWTWVCAAHEAAPAWAEWLEIPDEGFTTAVTFVVQPYRYKYPQSGTVLMTRNSTITNPCTASSAPVIYVTGGHTAPVTLMVGRYSLELAPFEGTMRIDCEEMMATNTAGTVLMNSYITAGATVSDDRGRLRRWPLLKPGYNSVSWTGDIQVSIEPRWRDR